MTYMTLHDGGECQCNNCNLNPDSERPGKLEGSYYVGGHGLVNTPGFVKGTFDENLKLSKCGFSYQVWRLTGAGSAN